MGQTTFYSKTFTGWPPILITEHEDPDSYHWQSRVRDMQVLLTLKMGEKEFEAWADRLFPDESIDEATWKEIFELYEAKFRVLRSGNGECTCLPDLPDGRINGGRGHICPGCAAEHRENDEIPF